MKEPRRPSARHGRKTYRGADLLAYIADVGPRLRELRLEAELSQEAVAAGMQASREHIARLENGHHPPSLDTVYRYAAVLEIDVRDVLCVMDERWRFWSKWRYQPAYEQVNHIPDTWRYGLGER